MNLKDQVCSLELSKRLKELNCKQDSLWWWVHRYDNDSFKLINRELEPDILKALTDYGYSAFTVAELYKILSDLNPHWGFNNSLGLIPEEVANYLAEEIINGELR